MTEPQIHSDALTLHLETPAFNIMRSKLGDSGMQMLDQQLTTWAALNERDLQSPLREAFMTGSVLLPKGTLLHSTGLQKQDDTTLESISRMGLVSGELIGKIEDSETHGCVDFFKVPESVLIAEYMDWAKSTVSTGAIRHKRGENILHRGVTFIVDPQSEGMADLLVRDGYRDPEMEAFVHPPSARTAEDTSAILGGVPKGAIAGIITAARNFSGEDLARVHELFHVPIFSGQGERLDA